jgi:hypothetical protein
LDNNPTSPSTSHKNYDLQLNVDVMNFLAKVIVPIPLIGLMKIPSQMDKVRIFLSIEDEPKEHLTVLKTMNCDRNNGGCATFFITLVVNNLLIHNCMLDSRASTNVMSLKVMNQLGLKTTRPYRNV